MEESMLDLLEDLLFPDELFMQEELYGEIFIAEPSFWERWWFNNGGLDLWK